MQEIISSFILTGKNWYINNIKEEKKMNEQCHNALLFKKYFTSNDLNSFQQQHC